MPSFPIDPHGRRLPITITSDHYFNILSVRPFSLQPKHTNLQVEIMFTFSITRGLAEWIMDDPFPIRTVVPMLSTVWETTALWFLNCFTRLLCVFLLLRTNGVYPRNKEKTLWKIIVKM